MESISVTPTAFYLVVVSLALAFCGSAYFIAVSTITACRNTKAEIAKQGCNVMIKNKSSSALSYSVDDSSGCVVIIIKSVDGGKHD